MANFKERELLKKLELEETSENAQALARFRSKDILESTNDWDKHY